MNNNIEFIDSFLTFENTYKMFAKKVNGVNIWHYIRFNIYYSLLSQLGIYNVLLNSNVVVSNKKKNFSDLIKERTIGNQFFMRHREVLIIPHERKYKDENGFYRCIYTDLIDKSIHQSHYILDGISVFGEYTPQKSNNVIYSKFDYFEKKENSQNPYSACKVKEFENAIVEPIEKFFHIQISLQIKKQWKQILDNYLYKRRFLIEYYNFILNRVNPKAIMVVVSYSFNRMVLCEVAKRKKIPVIELQHGEMSKMVLPYCFPKKMKILSFPDFIFTFSNNEYIDKLPISKDRVIPVGFPELEKYVKKSAGKKNRHKTILFISQGQIEIAKMARELAERTTEEYKIIYKLHPKEYGNWEKSIGVYLKHSNIKVVGDYEHTIYQYLSEADWVVGAYSTVLLEATAFFTKIAIIKSSMSSSVEKLVYSNHAIFVSGIEELINAIKKDAKMDNPTNEYFAEKSIEKIQSNLCRIEKWYAKKQNEH